MQTHMADSFRGIDGFCMTRNCVAIYASMSHSGHQEIVLHTRQHSMPSMAIKLLKYRYFSKHVILAVRCNDFIPKRK